MRFCLLGSGSRGNALVVEVGPSAGRPTRVMVDCGFALREVENRLAGRGLHASGIDAIVVTHEHGDHASGVFRLARRHRLPVWLTHGTRVACAALIEPGDDLRLFDPHQDFVIGDLQITPYPVPHDAREPAQFVFSDGARRLGVLTDAGETTPHIEAVLSGVDALVLECNHDRDLLAASRYHETLKRRIAGRLGHLGNDSAAGLLAAIDCARLQHLVAAHLSAENNRPELALAALAAVLGCTPGWLAVATQDEGIGWRDLRA